MRYQAYPKYKFVDTACVDKIPSNWNIAGLTKFIESRVDYRGKTPEKVKDGVFLITAKNIKNGYVDYEISKEYVREDEYDEIMRRGKPEIGDVLFTTEAPLGEVANVDREGVALAQRIIKFRGKKGELDNYFMKYWIMSAAFQEHLISLATGSTALGIKSSKHFELRCIIPTYTEQKKINNFLDHKTKQIDQLIEKKKALIVKLNEQRIAVITRAVTKGLDETVPMKDSGVDWLGQVPDHWNVVRFSYYISFQEGPGIMAVDFRDEGVPLLRIRNIQSEHVDIEGCNYLDPKKVEKTWKHFKCKKGDLIISGSASTGLVCEVNDDAVDTIVYTGLIRLWSANDDIDKEFIRWLVASELFFTQIKLHQTGSTIQHFGPDHLNKMLITLPSLDDQEEIVSHIVRKVARIDKMISIAKQVIERIKEYRTALITDAVTGKIDVRNIELSKDVV